MEERLYSVFRENNGEHLVFSQNGYVKDKIPFDMMSLLILHFADKRYHFLVKDRFKYEYHEGEEFTKFLKSNGVHCAEYNIEEIVDERKGIYKKSSGSKLAILADWIQTGYSYKIVDPDNEQPTLSFQTGKVGVIKVLPEDHKKAKVNVSFAYQGDEKDPEIQKFLKGVRAARRGDKVAGCITVLLMIGFFFLLGKVWTWIFGAPDDPFMNVLLPLI
jgi:hypothetical protein